MASFKFYTVVQNAILSVVELLTQAAPNHAALAIFSSSGSGGYGTEIDVRSLRRFLIEANVDPVSILQTSSTGDGDVASIAGLTEAEINASSSGATIEIQARKSSGEEWDVLQTMAGGGTMKIYPSSSGYIDLRAVCTENAGQTAVTVTAAGANLEIQNRMSTDSGLPWLWRTNNSMTGSGFIRLYVDNYGYALLRMYVAANPLGCQVTGVLSHL